MTRINIALRIHESVYDGIYFYLMFTRNIPDRPKSTSYYKIAITFLWCVLLAIVIRITIVEPFKIPTGSMKGNLLVGDFIFATKYSYGYSRYSFPFNIGPFKDKILYTSPKRGDVVIFRPPSDVRSHYIKRVIGLPGDTVQIKHGVVHVNGVAAQRKRVEDFIETNYSNHKVIVPQYEEILPGMNSGHKILLHSPASPLENTQVYHVPKNHFFVMGDNRDESLDSRKIGFIPSNNIVGKAGLIFFSTQGWTPPKFRVDRFFKRVK